MSRRKDEVRNNDVTIRNDLTCLGNRAGWVLVGGASRRMGFDKALIEIDGQPLVLRVSAEAAKVCGSVTLVGDPARYRTLAVPMIADEFPGQGPLAGIEAALRATQADWNLILACDMPALTATVFEALFAAGGDCSLPKYDDGRVEPLCGVYHRKCHGAVRAALMAGIRKVTDALRNTAIRYVPVRGGAPFANLNTPEDVRDYILRDHKDG